VSGNRAGRGAHPGVPAGSKAPAPETHWDPGQYTRFSNHRLRPALELLARVPLESPRLVVDLGCGTGNVTRILADRWPGAKVVGVDNSPQMLAEAQAGSGGEAGSSGSEATFTNPVRWVEADIATWTPDAPSSGGTPPGGISSSGTPSRGISSSGTPSRGISSSGTPSRGTPSGGAPQPDVLYSNAALHWLGDHDTLFPRLAGFLGAGGCLAVQMPLSWDAPSHRIMRDLLENGGPNGKSLGPESLRQRMARRPVADIAVYYDLLAGPERRIDIWETEYLQVLTGKDPVLDWVKGTGLRPVLKGLSEPELERFLSAYRRQLREAYPPRPNGTTLYPFRRLFIVMSRG
jgi:trans-aconitate 2-methyltransferase